jgi:hypothetical protein
MRHLYKTHPGKPAKAKGTPRETSKAATRTHPVQTLTSPLPAPQKPEQSQVHPFILLSAQQKLVFVARVLFVIFTVYMRQMEENQELQEDQELAQEEEGQHEDPEQHQDCNPILPQQSAMPPSKDKTSPTPGPDSNPIANLGTVDATSHHQICQGKARNDSDLEDSDDEDGGVSLSDPELGDLPPRVSTGSEEGQWDELDGYISLD